MFKQLRKRNGSLTPRREDAERSDYEHGLTRLRNEFDTLVDRFFEAHPLGDPFSRNMSTLWDDTQWDWNWNAGWEENEKEYLLQAELPGFEPDDLDISISGNVLRVHAEKKQEQQDKEGGSSYHYGSFHRTLSLPRGFDREKVDADYRNGILRVRLPKTEEAKGRRIEVKTK
jgi:HSP20 family protein